MPTTRSRWPWATRSAQTAPAVLMGDFNEWSRIGGALRSLGEGWRVLPCGRSFPSRRPVAMLDRIVASLGWECLGAGVHHSPLAAVASDHLPVTARLRLARANGLSQP